MKTIQYYTKNVYGKELQYFADYDEAIYFYNLTGSKTISPFLMNQFTLFTGIEFKRVFEPATV